ncbi:MAG: hypothetical protein A3J42_07750 [Candidatus Dadabacteria bacterium RIFCSPHIGHO2_12_FULL_53_21]|nr:MAG: hypothetical protein A3J42_07750 [Candidatus Dadabacteria bacterium RIFCSPHIGHO2_12_FULL_53_21]
MWNIQTILIKLYFMKIMGTTLLTLIITFIGMVTYAQTPTDSDKFSYDSNQVLHPEWYIKITDWSFYTAARVAILSSVTIENTADVTYKDVRVNLIYTSYSAPAAGIIATSTGMLPVTLPPKSKMTYLKGGQTMGAGNQNYDLGDIQVLSATPVRD